MQILRNEEYDEGYFNWSISLHCCYFGIKSLRLNSCSTLDTLPILYCMKVMREFSCRQCNNDRQRNAIFKTTIINQNYCNRVQHAMHLDACFSPDKPHTTEGQSSTVFYINKMEEYGRDCAGSLLAPARGGRGAPVNTEKFFTI